MRKVLLAVLAAAVGLVFPAAARAAANPTATAATSSSATPTTGGSPGPDPARAPEYQSSEPGDGETVTSVPSEVSATFSEPLDPSSTLVVHNPCHEEVSGDTEVFANEMSVPVEGEHSGHYTVTYRAVGLGGVSGTSEGSFAFHVTNGPSCDDGGGGKCNMPEGQHPGHDDKCKRKNNCNNMHGGHGAGNDECKPKNKCKDMHGGHRGEGCDRPNRNHGNNHGDDHPGDDHDDTDHGDRDHDGMDHGSEEHGDAKHGGKHEKAGEHKGHDKGGKNKGGSLGPLAGGSSTPRPRADAQAVAIALALAALMGVVGGWVLRVAPAG